MHRYNQLVDQIINNILMDIQVVNMSLNWQVVAPTFQPGQAMALQKWMKGWQARLTVLYQAMAYDQNILIFANGTTSEHPQYTYPDLSEVNGAVGHMELLVSEYYAAGMLIFPNKPVAEWDAMQNYWHDQGMDRLLRAYFAGYFGNEFTTTVNYTTVLDAFKDTHILTFP